MSTPTDIDTGGPAFASATCGEWQDGMTLRDWFAGQALGSVIECHQRGFIKGGGPAVFAETAYQIADAMIEARKQKGIAA